MNAPSVITPDLAAGYRQARFNPLRGLTSASLASLRDAYDYGYLRGFAMLGDQIADVDDTAGTVMDKRCGQVARRSWDVLIGEDVPDQLRAEAARHQEVLKFAFSNLRARSAIELEQMGGITLLLQQMMRAAFFRYSAHEIVWKPSTSGLTLEAWHVPTAFFESTRGDLRFAGPMGATPGQILSAGNWLIGVHHRCLMKSIATLYLFKKLSLSDWVNFSEKFGTPGLHLETNATPGSSEWNKAVNALAEFARDFAMVTSQGQKLNLIEASTTGDGPFAPMVDRCDRAMARVTLGSDLATLSRENGAGASLQGEDADEIIAADCEWVSETLNERISRHVIEYHFGLGTIPLAYIKVNPPQRQDTKLEMEVDKHVKAFGVNLTAEDIAERYGRTHAVQVPSALPADAANESAQLKGVRSKVDQTIRAAFAADLSPARDALMRIERATSFEDLRNAIASLNVLDVEGVVMGREALASAMEVIIAAEFLAGLSAFTPDKPALS